MAAYPLGPVQNGEGSTRPNLPLSMCMRQRLTTSARAARSAAEVAGEVKKSGSSSWPKMPAKSVRRATRSRAAEVYQARRTGQEHVRNKPRHLRA
jgi:hypothetical protein